MLSTLYYVQKWRRIYLLNMFYCLFYCLNVLLMYCIQTALRTLLLAWKDPSFDWSFFIMDECVGSKALKTKWPCSLFYLAFYFWDPFCILYISVLVNPGDRKADAQWRTCLCCMLGMLSSQASCRTAVSALFVQHSTEKLLIVLSFIEIKTKGVTLVSTGVSSHFSLLSLLFRQTTRNNRLIMTKDLTSSLPANFHQVQSVMSASKFPSNFLC